MTARSSSIYIFVRIDEFSIYSFHIALYFSFFFLKLSLSLSVGLFNLLSLDWHISLSHPLPQKNYRNVLSLYRILFLSFYLLFLLFRKLTSFALVTFVLVSEFHLSWGIIWGCVNPIDELSYYRNFVLVWDSLYLFSLSRIGWNCRIESILFQNLTNKENM